ncbi:hypothetical protein PSTG_11587 [Puccinia striiformis f. sp. tritici PST-78]|uniref:Uncharacterized protein n=1 Tax=Puccinia striiformis f. sp. tritici PST-78 TaxID=1165861 RepID=A0A0L0V722_9BASI|nr:hypothetical protein PSTG_11587 [Puccinia striiformis f. sp. tritici PST-78]
MNPVSNVQLEVRYFHPPFREFFPILSQSKYSSGYSQNPLSNKQVLIIFLRARNNPGLPAPPLYPPNQSGHNPPTSALTLRNIFAARVAIGCTHLGITTADNWGPHRESSQMNFLVPIKPNYLPRFPSQPTGSYTTLPLVP